MTEDKALVTVEAAPIVLPKELQIRGDDGELLEVPEEFADSWRKFVHSSVGPSMKRAVLRVLNGARSLDACDQEGGLDPSGLHKRLRFWGMTKNKTGDLVKIQRDIAQLGGEEIRRRLLEHPESIKIKEIAVVTGIGLDKVFDFEKGSGDDGAAYISALEQVAKTVSETGRGVELRVSLRPTDGDLEPEPITIEVEP
jgi:hypothetical protein